MYSRLSSPFKKLVSIALSLVLVLSLCSCTGGQGVGGGLVQGIIHEGVYQDCNSSGSSGSAKSISEEEAEKYCNREYLCHGLLYLMNLRGYTTNAKRGVLSYALAEGAGFGSFTYESYYLFAPFQSKSNSDTTLDNKKWREYCEGKNYPHSLNTSAFGIGAFAHTNHWGGSGWNAHAASEMIDDADAGGYYWQDPMWQFIYSLNDLESEGRSKDSDWANPKTYNGTDVEYAERVTCFIGMPGWSLGHGGTYMERHLESCTNGDVDKMIDSFDEGSFELVTFGSPLGDSVLKGEEALPETESKSSIAGGSSSGKSSSGSSGSSTKVSVSTVGNDLATTACKLAYSQSTYCSIYKNWPDENSGTLAYREAFEKYYNPAKTNPRDCGRGVTTIVRNSGVDESYPLDLSKVVKEGVDTTTGTIREGSDMSKNWTVVASKYTPSDKGLSKSEVEKFIEENEIQPGDIFVARDKGNDKGHTCMYVGYSIPQEVYENNMKDTNKINGNAGKPGDDVCFVSAHLNRGDPKHARRSAPCMQNIKAASAGYTRAGTYLTVIRCTKGGSLLNSNNKNHKKCDTGGGSVGGNSSIAEAAVTVAYDPNNRSLFPMESKGCGWSCTDPSAIVGYYDLVINLNLDRSGKPYVCECSTLTPVAIRWSGADDGFPTVTGSEISWCRSHTDKWKEVGDYGSSVSYEDLMPGDVMISDSHTWIFCGNEAVQKKFPDSTCDAVGASLGDHTPTIQSAKGQTGFHVFRNIKPEESSKYTSIKLGDKSA